MNNDAAASLDPQLNLASAWEVMADDYPERPALAHGAHVISYAQFDDRAARLAAAFGAAGVGRGAKVCQFQFNGNDYLEVSFAAFKCRAVPCNVNYRYLADELRYVLNNADAEVLVFDATLRELVDEVRRDAPTLKLLLQVNEPDNVPAWAIGYEDAIADNDPATRIERSNADEWFLYTGGTTGMPKAVMWEHGPFFGGMAATYKPYKLDYPRSLDEVRSHAAVIGSNGGEFRQLAAAPLMHGTSIIPAMTNLAHGGMVATLTNRHFDADELWRMVELHGLTMMTVVGDAFCRPMIDALQTKADAGGSYDLSSLRMIMSSGVMWSAPVKEQLLDHLDVLLVDSYGSSEAIGMAKQLHSKNKRRTTTAKFKLSGDSRVFTDDGREVAPGSGEIGRVAHGFPIPKGYFKDPEKTEATFPMIDGRRWSIPGDFATIEADGTLTLLGRGNVCINTGGEKVYPEEVEEVVKEHHAVVDCNCVGLPDERWGQAICAVIEVASGADVTDADLIAFTKTKLAGYKAPKRIVRVDTFERKSNGKPDYVWAKAAAEAALQPKND